MATGRVVNTNFWKDSYIIDLEPNEKLLFIYFLTNPRTTLAGIYEISLREVAFDTGLDAQFIEKTLNKFTHVGKMYFENNWLVLTNFIKHQRLNPSIIRGIEKAIEELPEWLRNKIELAEDSSSQLSIFITDTPQTGNNLGTTTPQLNIIKSNINKIKEKKPKQQAAGDSKESGENSKPSGEQYRKAVEADKQLENRKRRTFERKPTKPTKASDVDPYALREGRK